MPSAANPASETSTPTHPANIKTSPASDAAARYTTRPHAEADAYAWAPPQRSLLGAMNNAGTAPKSARVAASPSRLTASNDAGCAKSPAAVKRFTHHTAASVAIAASAAAVRGFVARRPNLLAATSVERA